MTRIDCMNTNWMSHSSEHFPLFLASILSLSQLLLSSFYSVSKIRICLKNLMRIFVVSVSVSWHLAMSLLVELAELNCNISENTAREDVEYDTNSMIRLRTHTLTDWPQFHKSTFSANNINNNSNRNAAIHY